MEIPFATRKCSRNEGVLFCATDSNGPRNNTDACRPLQWTSSTLDALHCSSLIGWCGVHVSMKQEGSHSTTPSPCVNYRTVCAFFSFQVHYTPSPFFLLFVALKLANNYVTDIILTPERFPVVWC